MVGEGAKLSRGQDKLLPQLCFICKWQYKIIITKFLKFHDMRNVIRQHLKSGAVGRNSRLLLKAQSSNIVQVYRPCYTTAQLQVLSSLMSM